MNQTSFILSGISNNKAAVGEAKGAVSQDVTEMEGEGFFAQLAQFVSGDTEASEGKQDIAIDGVESEAALNELLASGVGETEGKDVENLAPEGEEIDSDETVSQNVKQGDVAVSEEIALSLKSADVDVDTEATEKPLTAKQDGEAWLQRLNEANSVLKPQSEKGTESSRADQSIITLAPVGKTLPLNDAENMRVELESAEKITTDRLPIAAMLSDVKGATTDTKVLSVEDVKAVLASEGIDVDALSTTELEMIAKRASEEQALPAQSNQTELDTPLPESALRSQMTDTANEHVAPELSAETMAGALQASNALSQTATAQTANVSDPIETEMVAKSGAEVLTKPQQDALLRAQIAAQAANSVVSDDIEASESHMKNPATLAHAQNGLTQAASAVQAAVNPQLQQQTPASAFAAIPWTPAAMVSNGEPQAAASSAALDAATALQMTEATQTKPEVKAEHLAQQLATSFGNQGSTTAARLDNTVVQTPLQLSQNQTDDAATALQERVNMMMSKNLKHVDIRLDPPELGRMQIKLSMNQDQASVQFTVANQAARDMVEQTLPRLREMMQQQGLQLAQSSVQQQDAGGRQAFAGQQSQQGDNQSGQGGQDGTSRFGRGDGDHEIESSTINRELYVNTSKDRVDYYA
ncbi:flagellar hook-length control protein FliK [Enterovibrio sp. ZSDZ35]|uniref:Flagellar hook-length control protein FliK n=1 Tax=Enterovibrio qingdaonensis TaxID=2899818 RepID=A0ABT5QQK2_9GAMM|nr:flagellar hook-length control protein FliK [Enterovibrio sp. ZSDZ35]MDD1783265.1 flagellar hook-length control protein FliK [Enterovibrio sp. ZSDZ35]